MASENKERVKIYLVAGLVLLFVLTGYFRFLHGKVSLFGQKARDAGPAVKIEVPSIDLTGVRPAGNTEAAVLEPPRTTLRNIFAPVVVAVVSVKKPSVIATKPAEATVAPSPKTLPPPPPPVLSPPPVPSLPPLPSLTLTGTIVGGKKPLAIINGRFVGKGEWIEGLQVVSITKNQASLVGGGRSLTLSILEVQSEGK